MSNDNNLLRVDNLKTNFYIKDKKVEAVRGVSFHVNKGDILGIVGESGSGKSVLMKSVMNILPENAKIEDGKVYFNNIDISSMNKKEMKNAVVFLATGFEEIEALGTIDVLRRGGVRVMMVSITGDRLVIGAHDIPVMADYLFEEADFSCVDALILPGGIPGSNHLNAHAHLKELVKEKTEEGVLIGAICAGPMVLGGLGLLKGKRATCFPFFEPTMVGATPTDNGVEQDGNIITSKGPGFMFEFGLTILRNLKDEEIALEVADALLYDALLHGTKH